MNKNFSRKGITFFFKNNKIVCLFFIMILVLFIYVCINSQVVEGLDTIKNKNIIIKPTGPPIQDPTFLEPQPTQITQMQPTQMQPTQITQIRPTQMQPTQISQPSFPIQTTTSDSIINNMIQSIITFSKSGAAFLTQFLPLVQKLQVGDINTMFASCNADDPIPVCYGKYIMGQNPANINPAINPANNPANNPPLPLQSFNPSDMQII